MRGDADSGGGGRIAGSGGEDGRYEKALPCHGDELAHKLISIVQKNPGQILRYSTVLRCCEKVVGTGTGIRYC